MIGTIMGFVAGYMLGLTDGQNQSAAKTVEAWHKIRKSSEFRALISGGSQLVSQVLNQWLTQMFPAANQGNQANVLGQLVKQGVTLLINQGAKSR